MASLKRNRVVNTSLVLREIWTHREISRIQIAKNLDLDKSTITSIVTELLEDGLVLETATGPSGPHGGRKPVMLRLNGSTGSVLGIELKPDGYTAVAVDLSGKILESRSGDVSIDESNLAKVFLGVMDGVRKDAPWNQSLKGIGVGLSGVVNPERGIIRYSIPLGIVDAWDFRTRIAAGYDLPIFIENDANACAWAELAFHRTRKLRNFLFVLLEFRDTTRLQGLRERTALGLGIVIEGAVHHGRTFSAGEFRSILRGAESGGQFSLTGQESGRLTDDPEVLRRLVTELARNVALIANALNLDEIYLGGDIERYGQLVAPIFENELQDSWPYPDRVHCRVRFSSLGARAVAYGAAGLVLHRLYAELGGIGRLGGPPVSLPPGMVEKFRRGTIGFLITT